MRGWLDVDKIVSLLAVALAVALVVMSGQLRSAKDRAAQAEQAAAANAATVDSLQEELGLRDTLAERLDRDKADSQRQYDALRADIARRLQESDPIFQTCADMPVPDDILERMRHTAAAD